MWSLQILKHDTKVKVAFCLFYYIRFGLYLQVTWSDLHILHTANVHIQFLHYLFQTIFSLTDLKNNWQILLEIRNKLHKLTCSTDIRDHIIYTTVVYKVYDVFFYIIYKTHTHICRYTVTHTLQLRITYSSNLIFTFILQVIIKQKKNWYIIILKTCVPSYAVRQKMPIDTSKSFTV